VNIWLAAMLRAVLQAQDEGHLLADADAKQISFEIHALILALHYEARFLRSADSLARANAGFDNILARCATPEALAASTAATASPPRLKPVR
jgi:hypothetical protein